MCFRSSRAFRAYEKGRAIARTALVFRRFSACSAFSAITRIAVATSPSAYRVAATRIAVGMNAAHRTLPYDAAHPALPQTERIEQATAVAVVAVTAILAVLAAAILAVAVIVVAVVLLTLFLLVGGVRLGLFLVERHFEIHADAGRRASWCADCLRHLSSAANRNNFRRGPR